MKLPKETVDATKINFLGSKLNLAKLSPNAKPNLYVLLGLILFAVVIRLPWFYIYSINWDESVYILVGQSVADGHLPYTAIWENKPPLAFAFYAVAELIAPNSLAFIRLAGSIRLYNILLAHRLLPNRTHCRINSSNAHR